MESKSLIQPSETLTIKLIKTHKTLLIKLTESFSLELFDLKEKWYSLVAVWFWVGFHFFNHWLIFKPYESHFQGKTCEEIFFQKRLTIFSTLVLIIQRPPFWANSVRVL